MPDIEILKIFLFFKLKIFLVFKLAKVAQKIKKFNTQSLPNALPTILVPKMGDDLDRNQPMAVKGVATDR